MSRLSQAFAMINADTKKMSSVAAKCKSLDLADKNFRYLPQYELETVMRNKPHKNNLQYNFILRQRRTKDEPLIQSTFF